jgi:PrtD family type I secretion system ABC transporter
MAAAADISAEAAGEAAAPLDAVRRAVRRELWSLVGLSLALNLLMLTTSIYMLQVFDRVLGSASIDTLILLTALALVALAVFGVLSALRRKILSRTGDWVEARLGGAVIDATLQHRLSHQKGGATLRDLEAVRGFLAGDAVTAFLDAPWVPLFLVIVAVLHPVLGLVATVGAVLLFVSALVHDRVTRPHQRRAFERMQAANRRIGQALAAPEAVRGLGMRDTLVAHWNDKSADARRAGLVASDRTATVMGATQALRFALQVLILGAGAFLVLRGELTPGMMLAASILMSRALAPIERSIGSWRQYVAARDSWGRLKATLAGEGEAAAGAVMNRIEGRLSAERVSYVPEPGAAPLVADVGFTLAAGEALGILGVSGAGKSTLAKLLAGVRTPTSGVVRLDAASLANWSDVELARHVGYLPQTVDLFEGTVAENIARLAAYDEAAVVEAAERAGAHETILRLAGGYATPVGDQGRRLSGGQRQLVGLARALYGDPAVVVLDEPNANLDGAGETALLRTLEGLKAAKVTVVVVTHNTALLRSVDKIALLSEGALKLFGAREEVIERLNAPRNVVAMGGKRGDRPLQRVEGGDAKGDGRPPSAESPESPRSTP